MATSEEEVIKITITPMYSTTDSSGNPSGYIKTKYIIKR